MRVRQTAPAAALAACFAMVPPVLAQDAAFSPQSTVFALVQIAALAQVCGADALGMSAEDATAAEATEARLMVALKDRAAKIYPEATEGAITRDIRNWMVAGRTSLEGQYRAGKVCDQVPAGAVSDAIARLATDQIATALTGYGQADLSYDDQRQVAGGTTYALAAQERAIIADAPDLEACAGARVASVALLDRATQSAPTLPPFIAPPIRYVERWRFACEGADGQAYDATFTRDSEGPVGEVAVTRHGGQP